MNIIACLVSLNVLDVLQFFTKLSPTAMTIKEKKLCRFKILNFFKLVLKRETFMTLHIKLFNNTNITYVF